VWASIRSAPSGPSMSIDVYKRQIEDLVLLDQRVGEQALAHLRQRGGVGDLELDQPPDPHIADAGKTERRERALGCGPLRVEDAGLGANEDAGVHLIPC